MLRISFPAKSKHAQTLATQIEVDSTPLSFVVFVAAALFAGLLFIFTLFVGINILPGKSDNAFWRHMADTSDDDQAHVMGKVLSGDAAHADIVILGTSATREALLLDEQLEEKLALSRSSPLSIMNLATSAQSPIESLFLTDTLEPQSGQVFLLFVSIISLQQSIPFDRIEHGVFLRPPEAIIEKYAGRGILPTKWQQQSKRVLYRIRAARAELYRHLHFRLKYWIQEVIYGKSSPHYSPYLYIGKPSAQPEAKRAQIDAHQVRFQQHQLSNLTYLKNSLDVLASFLSQRKCRLVIATPPEFNHEMRNAFPSEFQLFNSIIQNLRVTHPIELVDFNDEITWSPGDFVDLTHVTQPGRDRWSEALVTWLSKQPERTAN